MAQHPVLRSTAMLSSLFIAVGLLALGVGRTSVSAAINATLTVNSTSDVDDGSCDGTHCSLREAIIAANSQPGLDTIAFNIAGPAPHTIFLLGTLPNITGPTTIDGTTAPDFSGAPVIELTGRLQPGAHVLSGLWFLGGSSTVRGLVINGFRFALVLDTAGDNTIQGNYFGTDASGTESEPNGQENILVSNSPNNLIGGTSPGARNVIAHYSPAGHDVYLRGPGSHGNVVQGNFLGTDVTGTVGLSYVAGGEAHGVFVEEASNNLIGGTTPEARNIISGHSGSGVLIFFFPGIANPPTGNVIEGNYIGTDLTGALPIANGQFGVFIQSPGNTVGVPGAGNVISGNVGGISVQASDTRIQGNLIGTDSSGTAAIGNLFNGINVGESATNTLIGGTSAGAGNVISGNRDTGLLIGSSTTIQGNKIGTDITGLHALGNDRFGIVADGSDNVIGGVEEGARNIISASVRTVGILICTSPSIEFCVAHDQRNRIQGNYIGTDVTGAVAFGNAAGGVYVTGSHNVIGGDTAAARNLISGNGDAGLVIRGADNQAIGNYVGTNATGSGRLGNMLAGVVITGTNQMLGGTGLGDRNLISGNYGDGVRLFGVGNHAEGNFIGTDHSGATPLSNSGTGVTVNGESNEVGGTTAGMGNLISGNGSNGVLVTGESNLVQGNLIGTDVSGLDPIGNGAHGIEIQSERNLIGGRLGGGNTIAFNGGAGVAVLFGFGHFATGNGILSNSIHSNATLGIDLLGSFLLKADGVTPNDAGDADIGGNELQNFPVLTSAVSGSGGTIVQGTLNSTPSISGIKYRLEFFSNPACDPSGHGQGETFLGASDATTDPDGSVSFVVPLPGNLAAGSVITSTATDPANSTSEFSACITVGQAAATNITLTPSTATNPVGSTHTVTATVTKGTSPETNKSVAFHIDSGPNNGASATVVTDTNGHATFSYTDTGGAGTDSISATVTDDTGAVKKATATKTWVALSDPAISALGTPVFATEASPFSGQVATFTDPDTAATASEYSATIDWGDATPTTAGAISGGSGSFSVSGTHTYAAEGTYTVTTMITDVDNTSNKATTTSIATVADARISASGASISATEGNAFSGQLASFIDPDTTGTPAEYSATINWGDGTTATPGAIAGSAGIFTVSGSHTYVEEGTFTATITITDTDTASNTATASTTALVADAALSARAACPTTSSQTYNGSTATFADAASPSGTLSDFSALVTWGDGTSSAGTVSGPNGGPYAVSGSHTYASTGPFTIGISITDVGGSRASTSCTPIVYGFATGGSFVVGDKSATGAVFFWGAQWAQWAKNNNLSGGIAPSSFKGFVDGVTQPACGIAWTTDPGNSSHPPASVPNYIAVIVSSSIRQSGSQISGNTVHVVVVKTDPGYGPAPGHVGTGTVVAMIC